MDPFRPVGTGPLARRTRCRVLDILVEEVLFNVLSTYLLTNGWLCRASFGRFGSWISGGLFEWLLLRWPDKELRGIVCCLFIAHDYLSIVGSKYHIMDCFCKLWFGLFVKAILTVRLFRGVISVPKMWEFCCGLCNVPCQSSEILERHNKSIKHEETLRSWDVFPLVDVYEFTVLRLSLPSEGILQRGTYSALGHILCLGGEWFGLLSYGSRCLYVSRLILSLCACRHRASLDLPSCTVDERKWCTVCLTYGHSLKELKDHNGGKKHKAQLVEKGLPEQHGDLAHSVEYMCMPFYVSEFLRNSKPIRYAEPLHGLKTIKKFREHGVSIPSKVRKVLHVDVGHRFTREEEWAYDCSAGVKELSEVHDSLLLVEKEIVAGIILFDSIGPEECVMAEVIGRGIYTCGGKVKRGKRKRGGDMVVCGTRWEIGRRLGDPDAVQRWV